MAVGDVAGAAEPLFDTAALHGWKAWRFRDGVRTLRRRVARAGGAATVEAAVLG